MLQKHNHKLPPRPLVWQFNSDSLKGRQYLKDLDFIHENMDVDMVSIACVDGVQLENTQQCHEAMQELVAHAHELGLKVMFRQTPLEGFFNALVNTPAGTPIEVDQAQIFPIASSDRAEGIVNDYEIVADENGYAELEHRAKWARNKIRPLRNRLLKVYAFHKSGEGFYEPGSCREVTEYARIINSRTGSCQIEFDGGKSLAGYTLFFMVVQYFNYNSLFADAHLEAQLALMDAYADIPFDGICMDENGYLFLNTTSIARGEEEPFRGRFYTTAQKKYFEQKYDLEFERLLFDMRYAPENDDKVRIRAINLYFDELRTPVLRNEHVVAEHAKKIWGDDIFLSCHNTFHNNLDNDEIWHTACAWWDLPRDFGHTDENITFPVRMGIMLAAKEPLMLDMFYYPYQENYYQHIMEGAPFNCRQFHHAYNDDVWGQGFKDKEFVSTIRRLDREIGKLDEFQCCIPKMDLLVIFGNSAVNNWYPDYSARNEWDIDGSLKILPKVDEIWKAGYRCALVPDYAITDGRIRCEDGRIFFNGHAFTHALFLYPKYARKEVYAFLDQAGADGVPIAAAGRADIDFDGDSASLNIPVYEEFSLEILNAIGCPGSAIPNGCIYSDGSFVLLNHAGLMEGKSEKVDIVIEGSRYTGVNTGILAYRNGLQVATDGGSLQKEK